MRRSRVAALIFVASVVSGCKPTEASRTALPADQPGAAAADQHFGSGLAAVAEGRNQTAFQAFAAALTIDPARADVLDARASLYLQLGDISEALADAERAVTLSPADPGFRSNRAQIYRQFGRTTEALADLDRALELDPDFFPALFNRGTLRFEMNRYEEALADFDRCVELDSLVAPPYLNRAVTLRDLGRLEEAKRDITRFLELEPQDAWRKVAAELLEQIDDAG